MRDCIICHFTAEADDIVIAGADGRCICLRCYERETGTALPMPKSLRRELTALLADATPS